MTFKWGFFLVFANFILFTLSTQVLADELNCAKIISQAQLRSDFIFLESGQPIFYQSISVPNPKGTFVLVNGLKYELSNYNLLIEELANSGYNVIVYSHRSQGENLAMESELNIEHGNFTFLDLTNDLEELLGKLNIRNKIHIMGLSLGASVASEYTIRNPDQVASLSLVAPLVRLDPFYIALRSHYLTSRFFRSSDTATERLITAVETFDLAKYEFHIPTQLILADNEHSILRRTQNKVWHNRLRRFGIVKIVIENSHHTIPSDQPKALAQQLVNFSEH